jgi:hypothetical protein
MFAAAQRRTVSIYDHSGAEVHVLERHIDVSRLEFLPYHFLLVSVGNAGYLKYQVCVWCNLRVCMTIQGHLDWSVCGRVPHQARTLRRDAPEPLQRQ